MSVVLFPKDAWAQRVRFPTVGQAAAAPSARLAQAFDPYNTMPGGPALPTTPLSPPPPASYQPGTTPFLGSPGIPTTPYTGPPVATGPGMGQVPAWAPTVAPQPTYPPTRRFGIYGEFLFLRPRNGEVAYAIPIDGPVPPVLGNAVQIGRTAVVDGEYTPGFRVGFDAAFSDSAYLAGQYTFLRASSSDSIEIAPPDVIRALVTHPLTTNAATDVLTANASLDIDLDAIDGDYRSLLLNGTNYEVEWLAGVRYANLDQQFSANFTDIGTTTVNTNVEFEGIGPRLGLDAQRRSCNHNWLVYGRGVAHFLAGEFDSNYSQTDSAGVPVVMTNWESSRIVPVLDLEFGVGWAGPGGRLRITTGYLISAWFNTVLVSDYIEAVQQNRFVNASDTLTFDGLVSRLEWRF